ncbi:hypothetical protein GCM10027258_79380 [Amycolatopsis stemonae]
MKTRTRPEHPAHGARGRGGRAVRAGLLLGAAGMLAAVVGGCSDTPAPPAPTPPSGTPVATVPLPAPSADGPVLTVDGQASWATGHPGCAVLRTDAGQEFSLVGPATQQRLGEVRSGASRARQRVRITGYVPKVGASVCGALRAFVAETVTAMN